MRLIRWAVLFTVFAPFGVDGQVVAGRLLDAATDEPIVTAHVSLLNTSDSVVARTVTDANGAFRFSAPTPGTYRVRAEALGWRTVVSDAIDVLPDSPISVDLHTQSEAISLAGITVDSERRCEVPTEQGAELSQVWDRARLVLELEAHGREDGGMEFLTAGYTRQLSVDGRRVIAEETRPSSGYESVPYRSAPYLELLNRGWIQTDDESGEWRYYAPDAPVLLSDAFLEDHCFQLVRSAERPGLLGLAFVPAQRRTVPQIEGELWLDDESSKLRLLTFRYTRLPAGAPTGVRIPDEAMAGQVEFLDLPDGAWIIGRWRIRLPVLQVGVDMVGGRMAERVTVGGIHEEGGEVLEVRLATGALVPGVPDAMANEPGLRGVVFDPVSGFPLEGAEVFVSGSTESRTTDEHGRFEFRNLPPGNYFIGFSHPILAELDLGSSLPTQVEVAEGEPVVVNLAVPQARDLLALLCELESGGSEGAVAGRVLDGEGGVGVPEAQVRLTIIEGEILQEVETDSRGAFRFCRVPAAGPVTLHAEFLGYQSSAIDLEVAPSEAEFVDLMIPFDPPEVGHVGMTADIRLEDAPGLGRSIRGELRDSQSGEPIGQAVISIPAIDRTALSDAQGRFRFDELPLSDFFLEVVHIGYGTQAVEVELPADQVAVAVLELTPRPIALDGVEVVGATTLDALQRRSPFASRVFAGQDLVEAEVRGSSALDLLRTAPGVRVRPDGSVQLPRGSCPPRNPDLDLGADCVIFVVDGVRMSNPLNQLPLSDIQSIEVLPPVEATFRFGLAASGGAVVIFTRGRGPYRDSPRDSIPN